MSLSNVILLPQSHRHYYLRLPFLPCRPCFLTSVLYLILGSNRLIHYYCTNPPATPDSRSATTFVASIITSLFYHEHQYPKPSLSTTSDTYRPPLLSPDSPNNTNSLVLNLCVAACASHLPSSDPTTAAALTRFTRSQPFFCLTDDRPTDAPQLKQVNNLTCSAPQEQGPRLPHLTLPYLPSFRHKTLRWLGHATMTS